MKIKSIHIKNVRGFCDHHIELNMIPNKPSLLVAPNGSGKSSFAFAFQWLNRLRLKLDTDDAFEGNVANKPELIIETDEPREILIATENENKINKKFGISVINNGLKAVSPGLANGYQMGKSRMIVPDIVLIEKLTENVSLTDNFEEVYDIVDAPKGLYPVINTLLSNITFMASLETASLKCGKREMSKIIAFIEKMKNYEGTIEAQHSKIEADDYSNLISIPSISYVANAVKKQYSTDSNAKLLIKAIKLVTLYYRKCEDMKQRIEYYKDKSLEKSYREFFSMLKQTWKHIIPREDHGKILIRIGDAQRISNGERDILAFMAKLHRAQIELTKEYNILIIDEVFDYLDDANLMAAQFYITKLIDKFKKEHRFIFPIILSHLNPDYYNQHFSFKDLKIYYLCQLPNPHASDNMVKLLRCRKILAQAAGAGNEENISKYMLHYSTDYSIDMTADIGDCPAAWGDINVFKQYCTNQLDNYLLSQTYDSLAVCVALREIIESYVYNKITLQENKDRYLAKHGTPDKLKYAETVGVNVPEIFYLLGNLYNDPMHVDNKSNKNITQTLYSRMENNTIREMIKCVKEMNI